MLLDSQKTIVFLAKVGSQVISAWLVLSGIPETETVESYTDEYPQGHQLQVDQEMLLMKSLY